MSGKNCQICGKPSGIYPLCKTHLTMKANNEVLKCETCGTWFEAQKGCTNCKNIKNVNPKIEQTVSPWTKPKNVETQKETKIQCSKCKTWHKQNEPCNCSPWQKDIEKLIKSPNEENEEENNIIVINEQNKHKCITCGKQVDGVLFCATCYRKYKDKNLYFKISKCSSVELLDEDYEGRYTCKDGHIVKSKSEREIDNYLFEHGIFHAYEKALPYGASDKEVLHPDFFLKDYLGKGKHVYIEHWGYNENNIQYTKTKKFKMPIYEKLGITLICTNEKTDTADIDTALDRKLNKDYIKENQINHKD